jgi:hypothetical protein
MRAPVPELSDLELFYAISECDLLEEKSFAPLQKEFFDRLRGFRPTREELIAGVANKLQDGWNLGVGWRPFKLSNSFKLGLWNRIKFLFTGEVDFQFVIYVKGEFSTYAASVEYTMKKKS